jgi:16S rRNA (guanine527-N7)-methyltransferase
MTQRDRPAISDEQIATALSPFGISPSSDQLAKIREYIDILLKWNRLLSLTTVIDPVEIVTRHFGESMFASTAVSLENCRLVDVGSGAGFPGLALKIAVPSLRLALIESNKKKCAFLSEASRALRLSEVEVHPIRFEDMRGESGSFDIVSARALGNFPGLLRWARQILPERGHVALWVGGEDSTRIASYSGWIWNPAVRIPQSQRRFILTGRLNGPRPGTHISK